MDSMDLVKVLFLAKKYLIKSLEKRCVTFFIMNLNAENVFSLLQHCIDFEADRILMEKCKEFLLFHTEEVLNSKAFTNISLKCLKALLEENFLDIAEVDLFKAVSLNTLFTPNFVLCLNVYFFVIYYSVH